MTPAAQDGIDGTSGERVLVPAAATSIEVPVVRLDPDLPLPGYAREGDAGADLVARTTRDAGPERGACAGADRGGRGHSGGIRRLRPAPERSGPPTRGDLPEHPRPDRRGVPRRTGRPAGQHRPGDAATGSSAGTGSPSWSSSGWRRQPSSRWTSWPPPIGGSAASGRRGGRAVERLSGLDGAFLSLESPTTHLQILGRPGLRPRRGGGGPGLRDHPEPRRRPPGPGPALPEADDRGPVRTAASGHGR